MKRALLLFQVLFITLILRSQPEITSWVRNTTGATGYSGIQSNVQVVQYSATTVYISCTCIPSYSIGPWPGNPNTPVNKNFVYKITRNPQKNTGTLTAIGLGHTGVWTNGVSIFNADDAQTYNNEGVWHRNAYYWEGSGFDNCLGHPAPGGEYHHHVNPTCLYNDKDSMHHSPIIGYSFDGFPVYGAYAYTNTNGTGAIKRMRSSYQLRNITTRTTLPDGSTASYPGPAIGGMYPLGCFIQDYVYVPGAGDLDDHNGRFCVTPEYPSGTYAYFITLDEILKPAFPYTMCGTYYGVVPAGNTGPNGGHNTISETTTVYNGTGLQSDDRNIELQISPNPASGYAYVYFDAASLNNLEGAIYSQDGRLMEKIENLQPGINYAFDVSGYSSGVYFFVCNSGDKIITKKFFRT
jgi:hypothetical protein